MTNRPEPLDFARATYPVAAVFLLLVAIGFGTAAGVAQSADPVPVEDVGSFALPAQSEGKAVYVPSDAVDLLGDPPCRAEGRTLEGGSAIAFPRSVDGEPTRLVARLGSVEPGVRVTCSSLAGVPGWLVKPSGTRWAFTALALVMLVALTFIRLVAGAVLGRRGDGD